MYCDVDGQQGVSTVRDWSYACQRFVGSNYALVGDAACFVDPILSGESILHYAVLPILALAVLATKDGDSDALSV